MTATKYICGCGMSFTPPAKRPWTRNCQTCGASITLDEGRETATAKIDHQYVKDVVLDYLNLANKDERRERAGKVRKTLDALKAGSVSKLKIRDLKPFLDKLGLG